MFLELAHKIWFCYLVIIYAYFMVKYKYFEFYYKHIFKICISRYSIISKVNKVNCCIVYILKYA